MEIETALRLIMRTLADGVIADHLCCGSLGLISILRLLSGGPWMENKELRDEAEFCVSKSIPPLVDRCMNSPLGMRCYGTQDGSLVLPGFFTGISGIAMALINRPETNCHINTILSAGLFSEAQ